MIVKGNSLWGCYTTSCYWHNSTWYKAATPTAVWNPVFNSTTYSSISTQDVDAMNTTHVYAAGE